jgi:hypothetical protein
MATGRANYQTKVTVTSTSTLLSALVTAAGDVVKHEAKKVTLKPKGTVYTNTGTADSNSMSLTSGIIYEYDGSIAGELSTTQFYAASDTVMHVVQEQAV